MRPPSCGLLAVPPPGPSRVTRTVCSWVAGATPSSYAVLPRVRSSVLSARANALNATAHRVQWVDPPPLVQPPPPQGGGTVTWPMKNRKSMGNRRHQRRRRKAFVGYTRLQVTAVWCPSPPPPTPVSSLGGGMDMGGGRALRHTPRATFFLVRSRPRA